MAADPFRVDIFFPYRNPGRCPGLQLANAFGVTARQESIRSNDE